MARRDRVHGADGVIPARSGRVVFFSAAVIFVFLRFFADSGEHAVVQALLIGSVIAVLVTTMFVLRVLDDPYHPGWEVVVLWRWNGRSTSSKKRARDPGPKRGTSLQRKRNPHDERSSEPGSFRLRGRRGSRSPRRSSSPSPPEYRLAADQDAEQLEAAAEAAAAEARIYIQRATNYVLGVVLFATSLFFAGISTKLGSPRLKKAVLVIGCTVFLAALAWISTFPIKHRDLAPGHAAMSRPWTVRAQITAISSAMIRIDHPGW